MTATTYFMARRVVSSVVLLVAVAMSPAISQTTRNPHLHSGVRCGTFIIQQLRDSLEALGGDDKARSILAELQAAFSRPTKLEKNIVSRNGHFRIHYTTNGDDAPSLVDLNNNQIPDYIDSVDYYMEYAWKVEIDDCHWATPPPDNPFPGSGGIDGLIDVYIINLDSQFYGLAQPDAEARLPDGRISGYLFLDDDYFKYATPGIEGLRVTSAHEFLHIIQFAGYYNDLSQQALYEATATYMEYKVHPDLEDYRNYFDPFLLAPEEFPLSPNLTSDGISGYAHSLYFQMLTTLIGDEIVRQIWDRFKVNHKTFDAINDALVASNTGLNLSNSYCQFAHWTYFTGSNARDTSFFKRAIDYRTIVPASIRTLRLNEPTVVVDSMSPLAFGVWRLIVERESTFSPDTLDFLITNARSDLGVGGAQWYDREEPFTLEVQRKADPAFLPILYRSDTLYYRLTSPHSDFCAETFINGSQGIVVVARPTPQPFINDGANQLLFGIDLGVTEFSNIHVEIYSMSMNLVASFDRSELERLDSNRGIIWDGTTNGGILVPSGIYIYTLQVDENQPVVGKIAVVGR